MSKNDVTYKTGTDNITPEMLAGFFVGWPSPPSPEVHLRLLRQSDLVELAVDSSVNRVVGFVTAITDGVLAAYLPLLEVLPEYQNKGIGGELMKRMMGRLSGLYMVDLVCDPDREAFYGKFGMVHYHAMMRRNHAAQSGVYLPKDYDSE